MADKDSENGEVLNISDDCEMCEQKEYCPVYMGQYCLLTANRA